MPLRLVSNGLFWFFCLAIASFAFLVASLSAIMGMAGAAPHLVHYVAHHNLPLYAHMICGPLALILLPFQFWRGLRNRHRQVHRALGYTYVLAVMIASVGAVMLLPRFQGSVWAAAGFGILALAWIGTTVRAVLLARAGQTARHEVWMKRSAALTFAAVVLRLITLPLMGMGMTLTQSYDVTAWASWLIPLLWVEIRTRRSAMTGVSTA
jgi:uncharacterized membrane protein